MLDSPGYEDYLTKSRRSRRPGDRVNQRQPKPSDNPNRQMGSTPFDGGDPMVSSGPVPSPNVWIDRGSNGRVRVGDRA